MTGTYRNEEVRWRMARERGTGLVDHLHVDRDVAKRLDGLRGEELCLPERWGNVIPCV